MRYRRSNKSDTKKEHLFNIMLVFIRAAVLDRIPEVPCDMVVDWDELMDLSSSHGVLAWVWEGICKLPIEQQPPRQQRISWGLSAQEIQKQYYLHREKLLEMLKVCDANGMKLLLLKGISLSFLYPKPYLRQSRDIDIYLFNDCERGNELLFDGEVELRGKHYIYNKNGIQIENHIQFYSNLSPFHEKIEKYLESVIGDSYKTEDGYYVMPQESLVIYLLLHSLIHLCHPTDPIRIQNIVDFGMVLKKCNGDLLPRLHGLLESLNLNKAFLLFVNLSEWVLDIDLSSYVKGEPSTSDDFKSAVNFFLDDNLRHPAFIGLPKYQKLFQRWSHYRQAKWRYKYIPTYNSKRKETFLRELSIDLAYLVINKKKK